MTPLVFDPAAWIVLPNGEGISRDSLAACPPPCGERRWRIWRSQTRIDGEHGPEWREVLRVGCPRCLAPGTQRLAGEDRVVIRTREVAVGWFDAVTGAMGFHQSTEA